VVIGSTTITHLKQKMAHKKLMLFLIISFVEEREKSKGNITYWKSSLNYAGIQLYQQNIETIKFP